MNGLALTHTLQTYEWSCSHTLSLTFMHTDCPGLTHFVSLLTSSHRMTASLADLLCRDILLHCPNLLLDLHQQP